MATVTDDKVLVIERVIATTPERLFDAWVQPDLLVQWWGPEGMSTPKHQMDVREGGAWETTMRNADGGEHVCCGTYRTIDRPNRLVFSWAWKQPDGNQGEVTEVCVTFTAVAGGTRMVLDQRAFVDETARDNHGMGWNSSFNCLEQLFA